MTSTHKETFTRPCPNHERTTHTYDYARQEYITEHCIRCGGAGFIYDRMATTLGTDDPHQDRRNAEVSAMGLVASMVVRQAFISPETYQDAKRIVAEWENAMDRLNGETS